MLDRYRLSEKGEYLKKFFTDNGFWMSLLALYVSYFKYKQVKNGNIGYLIDLCLELIKKGKANDYLLAEVLLYKATENTRLTLNDVREIFGVEISNKVQLFSNRFLERETFRDYCLTYQVEAAKELVENNEKYDLPRDGIFLERYAIDNEEWLILLALHLVNRYFTGMKRDDGSPEITHVVRVACDHIDRGVTESKKIIKALTHDLIENTGMAPEYIKKVFHSFNIANDTSRLSRKPEHEENPDLYFTEILESEDASVVKAVDIENVIGNAIVTYTIERLRRKTTEVKEHGLEMMKVARNKYDKFKGIFFSCRNHIKNIIDSIERYLAVVDIVVLFFKHWVLIDKNMEKMNSLVQDLDVEIKGDLRRNVIEELFSQMKNNIENLAEHQIGINEQKRRFFDLVKFEKNPLP